jgi:hypothetical protein
MKRVIQMLFPFNLGENMLFIAILAIIMLATSRVMETLGYFAISYAVVVALHHGGVKPLYRFRKND